MKKQKLLILGLIAFFVTVVFVDAVYAIKYDSKGHRDPFVPLVGVSVAVTAGGTSEVLTVDDADLQGIVLGADGKYVAIINGELMKMGDKKGRLSVVAITGNDVIVKLDEQEYKIKLYEQ